MRNDVFLIEIGKKLRARRKELKISLESMETVVGVRRNAISYIERGRKDFHILVLKSICDYLEMDVKDLF